MDATCFNKVLFKHDHNIAHDCNNRMSSSNRDSMAWKSRTFTTWPFTEKFANPCAKCRKLHSEVYIWHDSVSMMFCKTRCIGSENRSLIVWFWGGRRTDWPQRVQENFWGWKKCSISWSQWWFHNCVYLSKLTELHTIKSEFYCMQIIPQIIHR